MNKWHNKIAVVTGSSAGIGAACAKALSRAGMVVIGLDIVESLHSDLADDTKGRLHAIKCDVSNEQEVLNAFALIKQRYCGVDLLVNNAGIVRDVKLLGEHNTDSLKAVMDTNVLGVAYCTREAFKSMQSRSVDGHVININSITGHCIPHSDGGFSFNIYPASKHAVTAMTELYRREFLAYDTRVKITSISPGAVRTEILPPELFDDVKCLSAEDVSDAVLYVIQTPPNVQIHELTIKPVGERF